MPTTTGCITLNSSIKQPNPFQTNVVYNGVASEYVWHLEKFHRVFAEDEEERLVRLWLEPPSLGRRAHVKLAVLERDVMGVPVDIVVEHWYHFCQSWSNVGGQWALYINGQLAAAGEDLQVSVRSGTHTSQRPDRFVYTYIAITSFYFQSVPVDAAYCVELIQWHVERCSVALLCN
jgi:hypothetical protein